jgi:heme/copper-type cytochrome/quinol oxidase subunit 4
MKNLLSVTGTLIGFLLSVVCSITWFYTLTRHDPSQPAPLGYIASSALVGICVSLLSGYAGAVIGRGSERRVGYAIAVITLLIATWSWWETPGRAHWAQILAIVLMAPAAVLGSRLLTRRTQHSILASH